MREDVRCWQTPLVLAAAAPGCGAMLGLASNAINGAVCSDYFAIVLSCDGKDAATRAIFEGVLDGGMAGAAFAVLLMIAAAASTRMGCTVRLILSALIRAATVAATCWLIGGVAGVALALWKPALWGTFFVGVPSRVNLPRFVWVSGSIDGAFA